MFKFKSPTDFICSVLWYSGVFGRLYDECIYVCVCFCEACEMCYLFMIQSFSRRTIRIFTEKMESLEPDEMLY